MTAQADWDPARYDRFRNERAQPFADLLALVRPRPEMRVLDLGCGSGELTQRLHRALRARETVGIDNSPAMLAASQEYAGNSLRFVLGDLAALPADERADLIVSNAALQWAPDHETLLTRLTEHLLPRGQLAVQMPANHDHPSHRVAAEIAGEPPFRDALGGYKRRSPVLPVEQYAALLDRLGYREQHVRLQIYLHRLAAAESVVEWVEGTLLTDYRKRLPAELYPVFLVRYRAALLAALGDARPYAYPFKRILFWAVR